MSKRSKQPSNVMEVLAAYGLADNARLVGELLAAEFIDAIEHPEQIMELAQFANSEAGRRLARRSRKRQRKKATVDV